MKEILSFFIVLISLCMPFMKACSKNNETMQYEVMNVDSIDLSGTLNENIKNEQQEVQLVEEKKEAILTKQEEFNLELAELDSILDKKEWFLAYKDLVFEYSKWIDPPETVFDVFTEEEVRLMCQTVETECYQRDFDCKVNVASVIFNRYYNGKFGDMITEIITSPKQFAYYRETLTEDSILAVQYAFEIADTAQGALYFHSFDEAMPEFNRAKYIFSDHATHHFYK